MRKIRNIVSLILAGIICISAVSCASSEPETVPEYETSELLADLDGYEMVLSTTVDTVLGFIPNTTLADLAQKRLNDVEKQLNCKIRVVYIANDAGYDRMQASVVTGTHFCDAFQNESYRMASGMRAGYLEPLSGLFDMSDTAKWGTRGMLQSMCWDDDVYAVVPAAWPDLLYTSYGFPICVNENLVAEFGCSDPREYVETNTWTWDQFEECLHQYTQTEGDSTIYGIGVHPQYFVQMMLLSNGDSLVEERNGQIVCGAFTSTGVAALERAKEIMSVSCKECFHPVSSPSGVFEAFKNGECVLNPTWMNYVIGSETAILYNCENIGILPHPSGPNAVPGEYRSMYESMAFSISIPIVATDVSATAMILDEIYEPLEGYETEDNIIDYMMRQVFFDERDVNIILTMLKNTEFEFFYEGARALQDSIASSKTSVAETVQSFESVYDEILDEYLSHHYRGQVAVWGE